MSERAKLADLAAENRQMRRLRLLIDTACVVLRNRPLTRSEAEQVVVQVRAQALTLFPGKGETFDLIYGARFRRLLDQRFGAV
jgi:hypothetical protein